MGDRHWTRRETDRGGAGDRGWGCKGRRLKGEKDTGSCGQLTEEDPPHLWEFETQQMMGEDVQDFWSKKQCLQLGPATRFLLFFNCP